MYIYIIHRNRRPIWVSLMWILEKYNDITSKGGIANLGRSHCLPCVLTIFINFHTPMSVQYIFSIAGFFCGGSDVYIYIYVNIYIYTAVLSIIRLLYHDPRPSRIATSSLGLNIFSCFSTWVSYPPDPTCVEGRGPQFMTSFMGKRDGIGWNVIVFHMFIQTSPNDPNV